MKTITKSVLIAALAVSLATMLTVSASMDTYAQLDKKKPVKPVKCNNIKILVKVNNVKENQTYTANVTLGTGQKQKSAKVGPNETSIVLPVAFKKISPCPSLGFPFGGDVNGTEIKGTISSLQKPNKVTVDLN